MCNMYPFNRHSALVCALVRCQCFQGFAVLCVQEFKLTLSTPEVETFPFPRMHRFGPDQLLEPFLLGGDVASPYVGANALFAGPGGGLVALASLLFLQEDLIHWVLIFPGPFPPCSPGTLGPFCCNGPGTDWLPGHQGGPARPLFPHTAYPPGH